MTNFGTQHFFDTKARPVSQTVYLPKLAYCRLVISVLVYVSANKSRKAKLGLK